MATHKKRKIKRLLFDPWTEQLVPEYETTSPRIRWKLNQHYDWRFCDLCWRSTEYAVRREIFVAVKRLPRGGAKVILLTDAMRDEAKKNADAMITHFKRLLSGEMKPDDPFEAARMVSDYCNLSEMNHDFSIDSIQDHFERQALLSRWARGGLLVNLAQIPGQPMGSPKASKLYCENHNPRRSEEARRAYQRDIRFIDDFEVIVNTLWMENAGRLSRSIAEHQEAIRYEAYNRLQEHKTPTIKIDELLEEGITNQAEIARRLGISRQAVSAALRRRKQKNSKSDN